MKELLFASATYGSIIAYGGYLCFDIPCHKNTRMYALVMNKKKCHFGISKVIQKMDS